MKDTKPEIRIVNEPPSKDRNYRYHFLSLNEYVSVTLDEKFSLEKTEIVLAVCQVSLSSIIVIPISTDSVCLTNVVFEVRCIAVDDTDVSCHCHRHQYCHQNYCRIHFSKNYLMSAHSI